MVRVRVGTVFVAALLGAVAAGAQRAAAQAPDAQIGEPGGIWAPAVAASGDQQDVFELSTRHTVVHWRAAGASALARDDLGGYAVDGVAAAWSGTGAEVVPVCGADSAVWIFSGFPDVGR
jgi:hypothetical protein